MKSDLSTMNGVNAPIEHRLQLDDGARSVVVVRRASRVHVLEDQGDTISYEIGDVVEERDRAVEVLLDHAFVLDYEVEEFEAREELAELVGGRDDRYRLTVPRIRFDALFDRPDCAEWTTPDDG